MPPKKFENTQSTFYNIDHKGVRKGKYSFDTDYEGYLTNQSTSTASHRNHRVGKAYSNSRRPNQNTMHKRGSSYSDHHTYDAVRRIHKKSNSISYDSYTHMSGDEAYLRSKLSHGTSKGPFLGQNFSQMKRSKTNNYIQDLNHYKAKFNHSQGIIKDVSSSEDLSPEPTTITIRKKVKTAGDSNSSKNPFYTTFGPLSSIERTQTSSNTNGEGMFTGTRDQNPFESGGGYNLTPTLPNMDNWKNGVDDEPEPVKNIGNSYPKKKRKRDPFQDKVFQVKHPKQMSTASKRKRAKKPMNNAFFTNDKNFRNIEMTFNKNEDIM